VPDASTSGTTFCERFQRDAPRTAVLRGSRRKTHSATDTSPPSRRCDSRDAQSRVPLLTRRQSRPSRYSAAGVSAAPRDARYSARSNSDT
jgi:hypothetical protein